MPGNSLATQFTSNGFKTIATSFTAHTITTSANGAHSVYAIDLDRDDYVEVYAFAQVATDTPVLEATTTSDGSRALGRGLTFGGFRVTGL